MCSVLALIKLLRSSNLPPSVFQEAGYRRTLCLVFSVSMKHLSWPGVSSVVECLHSMLKVLGLMLSVAIK